LPVSHGLEETAYLADAVLVSGNGLRHDDARPRTVDTFSTPSFVAMKKPSLELFQREVRR